MNQITKNFTLESLTHSNTAISEHLDNTPSEEVIKNLTELAIHILQPLRDALGVPVKVDCGYRSPKVNAKVGGAKDSQHLTGNAADIKCNNNAHAFKYIQDHLPFDQLLYEDGNDSQPLWIHVSYSPRNRKQVLRKKTGSKIYTPFKL